MIKQNEITSTQYAEFRDDAPETWSTPRPAFDLDRFNAELVKRTGKVFDRPRFRCVWGGEREEYLIDEAEHHVGYAYVLDGEEHFVSKDRLDFEFPDGAIPVPKFETQKVYTPRFIIEEYRLHGIGAFNYHKAWAVEEVQLLGKKSGRVDLMSHYREPSEVDILRCEKLRYLTDNLTEDQIAHGIAEEKKLEARRRQHEIDEIKDDFAEEFVRLDTDGVKNESRFALNSDLRFDIKEFTQKKIQEHDGK